MRTMLAGLLVLFLLSAPLTAKDDGASRNLLENGSFEQAVPGAVPKDVGHGAWRLGGDGTLPAGWSLNAAYPGVLTVLEQDAADGVRCIQVTPGAERDAQLFRPCPAIRRGAWVRVSVRVRAGAATLLTYEYAAGSGPHATTLAAGTAAKDAWQTLTGFYTPSSGGFQSASIALLVPKGGGAMLDDVQVHAMDGPVADPDARPIALENAAARLAISGAGRLTSLTVAGYAEDLAAAESPVLVARHAGLRMPVATLARKGRTLLARFPDASVSVKLAVEARKRYFAFEVIEVRPKDLEELELRFPVKPRAVRDAWMPGTYDTEVGIAHMPVSANTHAHLGSEGAAVAPEARWEAWPGMGGGRSALVATSAKDFLPSVRQLESDTGLPSPVLPSSYRSGTGSSDWARVSPALKRSYLFATYLGFGDIDKLIEYARLGGFGLIMLHRQSWRASAGHEEIARTAFPEGLPTLAAVCRRIHDAGLGVGLHLYGPAVSTDDAYVTPVPDKRLFSYAVGTLAAPVKADATELVLKERPALPRVGAADVHPGNLLRLGDEIVRWTSNAPGEPARLVGCERGVFGTTRKSHKAGARVETLVMRNGGLLVDPDSTLPAEMGEHLGRVVNATQADLVYFDACAAAAPGQRPENWYYLNKVLLASCARFDHGVIVQTGMGPGRQLPWHLVPRSASADGHGDLKRYLDRRLPGIRQMRKTHVAADIGWYALDVHGRPDELEYVCAKALAFDASISVEADKGLLESHPRAREVFDMVARWERLRLSGVVPPEVRARLAEEGRDVRAVDGEQGTTLWEVAYDDVHAVDRLDGRANLWRLSNDREQPVSLAVEIQRVPLAATPAEHADPAAIAVEDFADAASFRLRDDATLAPHILFGGRALTSDGFARRGVSATLLPYSLDTVDGLALELRAVSSVRGAGWCAAGKTFAKPLDLSAARSLGLYVRGDGQGASLALTLVDSAGVRARYPVALDYVGWRFQGFERRGPPSFDWSKVAHLVLELLHIPPEATVAARVERLRAMATLHTPKRMPSVTVTVGRREVDLNVELGPGRVITIDPLGLGVFWPGGMQAGSPSAIAGGPLLLPPGTHEVGVKLQDPAGYAGDLRVRFCRAWPLEP